MARFSQFLAIDWSGAAGERHKGIALALADAGGGPPVLVRRGTSWSRDEVLAVLRDLPADTLVGMDVGISLPFEDCGAFFPGWVESPADAPALWALIDDICAGDPHFEVASFVDHPELAAYFRRHGAREGAHFGCDGAEHRRGRFRLTEHAQAAMGCKPYSNFNLVGAAQVIHLRRLEPRRAHRCRQVAKRRREARPGARIQQVEPLADVHREGGDGRAHRAGGQEGVPQQRRRVVAEAGEQAFGQVDVPVEQRRDLEAADA
ncbi:hypothetical protein J4558_19535 [Leptolyngbya sp. 15MV]|nr:hypothetical protein J4558_19535 [Leptolyngbya sp. 15MV]